jgi:dihydrolipoamide dehydrogenase
MAILDADVALVAIGRKPFTTGLGLEAAGVGLDERGRIRTDGHYKTNVEGIYAIGDVIVGPMLAHKAEDEGIAVAELIAGQAGHVNYAAMPAVVYTSPEIASVGKTEDELKAEGIDYKIGKFPFTANGRAKAMLATQGFVKILADVATDRVLGAHIIGKNASEMIEALTLLLEFGGSAEDLARTTAAHPTLSEAIREAALMCGDGAIHI